LRGTAVILPLVYLFIRVLAFHLHITAQGNPRDTIFRPASLKFCDRLTETYRKSLYLHPKKASNEIVPQLVYGDDEPPAR